MNELVRMAIDLYDGKITNFSKDETNEALRKALLETVGGELTYKSFRENQNKVFAVLEEALDVLIPKAIEGQFDRFVETRNVKFGDKQTFTVESVDLFTVAKVSAGTQALRAQRVDNGVLSVSTDFYGVKIYDELYRFLAGRIDWVQLVNKVAVSFANKVKSDVYNAIASSYSSLGATYGISGSFDTTKFVELAGHIKAATGNDCIVFGSKLALSKVVASGMVSDAMKEKYNQSGYLGTFMGVPLVEIEQVHKNGTDTFAIDNNMLIFVPAGGEKIVKLVFEGDAIIKEDGASNQALQMQYAFLKAYGVGVLASGKYGIYQLS